MRKLLGISVCVLALVAWLAVPSYAADETTVKGTVVVSKEGDMTTVEIDVAEGETLLVVGEKQGEVAALDGKVVEATGCVDNEKKEIQVTSVKEVTE